jgi:hypothetical protein
MADWADDLAAEGKKESDALVSSRVGLGKEKYGTGGYLAGSVMYASAPQGWSPET